MTEQSAPVLSRFVAVGDIPASGLTISVVPTPGEREALAALNNLVAITALSGRLVVRHEGAQGLHVSGEVTAEVTQTCVVSLEPFDSSLREPVDVHFLSPEAMAAWRTAMAKVLPNDDDNTPEAPDTIEGGQIDVGNLVAEHLTLGLDPYPRKPAPPWLSSQNPRRRPFPLRRVAISGREAVLSDRNHSLMPGAKASLPVVERRVDQPMRGPSHIGSDGYRPALPERARH